MLGRRSFTVALERSVAAGGFDIDRAADTANVLLPP
jgi:hypothetical protein